MDRPASLNRGVSRHLSLSESDSETVRDRKLASLVKKILRSAAIIYEVAKETPLSPMPLISKRLDNTVLIKREDLQPIFSFKLRGAYNKMSLLSDEQKARGVIAASAGNHAQGVALSAKAMGIDCTIVMPIVTPSIKYNAVRALGAKVVLKGENFDEASKITQEICKAEGRTYVSPYDDLDVIAGQGTIGMEILRQSRGRPVDAVFVQVGGGGLLAGILAYIKYLNPEVKVIAVESEESACLNRALQEGQRVTLSDVGSFAEGVAVKLIGERPWEIIQHLVDGSIVVSNDEICAAVQDVFVDTRAITETAGAISLAGIKKYVREHQTSGETYVCINSGANTSFDRLEHIAERVLLGEHREMLVSVRHTDKPGQLLSVLEALGSRQFTEVCVRSCEREGTILLGIRIEPDGEDRQNVLKLLREQQEQEVVDLTDNEMVKIHLRHMAAGGRLYEGATKEELYRFEFPERPRALAVFLGALHLRSNITMFHYRNHGTATGRVLMACQPNTTTARLEAHFDRIGYRYWKESDNVAYAMFLARESELIPVSESEHSTSTGVKFDDESSSDVNSPIPPQSNSST